MIKLVLIIFLISISYSSSCDWEVINYEAETKIYNITPINDSELVSYSYDGYGNMFYQYSSDNGSTWEVIREERTILFVSQPEKVVKTLKVSENTILFFRFYSSIQSYNTETKVWDSIPSMNDGASRYSKSQFLSNGKLIILKPEYNESGQKQPHIYISDTTTPLDFTSSLLFEEGDERNNLYANFLGINNDLVYYWYFVPENIYSSIQTYNIYTKETDSLVIRNPVKNLGYMIFHNDGIYLSSWRFVDGEKGSKAIDAFYKYNFETQKIDLIYKFDDIFNGEPVLEELGENMFSFRIHNKYYTFKNDVFQKIVEVPTVDCQECEDRKELISYNKYNNSFYYTTRGSCLFKSDDFYKELISEPTSVVEIPNLDSDYYIEYYDLQGNRMRNAMVESDLPNGLYLKSFKDKNNVISKTEKIIITK